MTVACPPAPSYVAATLVLPDRTAVTSPSALTVAMLGSFVAQRTELDTGCPFQSAIDAVKNWVYKPILLNGQPVGIVTTLIRGDVYAWGHIMTGALLGAAPPLIIYAFLMDYYISGLTAGATKG